MKHLKLLSLKLSSGPDRKRMSSRRPEVKFNRIQTLSLSIVLNRMLLELKVVQRMHLYKKMSQLLKRFHTISCSRVLNTIRRHNSQKPSNKLPCRLMTKSITSNPWPIGVKVMKTTRISKLMAMLSKRKPLLLNQQQFQASKEMNLSLRERRRTKMLRRRRKRKRI